jgi:hypothetical protein
VDVKKQLNRCFWIEMGVALASMVLLIVTLLWNDWIELVFRIDPDNASGTVEWLIVAVSFSVAVAFFDLARNEWRKAATLPA